VTAFRHQVFYQIGSGRPWTNVYHVDAADLTTAATIALSTMVPALLPLLDSSALLLKILTTEVGVPGSFIDTPVGVAGTSTASGDLLPLFNTARVLFSVGSGRLDSKFLRGFITESIQTNGIITSGALGVINAAFAGLIAAMALAETPFIDTEGNNWLSNTAQAAVQMRQLHRRRARLGP
jgi:hypothetical protein